MNNTSGVTATADFAKVLANMPPEQHNFLLDILRSRQVYLETMYGMGTPIEFVKAFYETFDETMAVCKSGVSCKKGCYFCCGQNVDLSAAEAEVIAEYCREHGIEISQNYLKRQLQYGIKEVAKTEVRWCAFLKEGECSIFAVRPLACRNYHVASDPKFCDTVTYPSSEGHRVAVAVFTIPELEVSAFYGVMTKKGKAGRMPEMLLPYSK